MRIPVNVELLAPVPATSTEPVRVRPKPTHHPELAKKPHIKVVEYAREIMGDRAAVALEAISNPRSRMHTAIKRRAIDMLFPRERPIRMEIPDIESAEGFNAALKAVHLAWTGGQISPTEARQLQELCEHRYRGWLKSRAGAGLR